MTTTATLITIRLLGSPEIEAQGKPLILKNQKARALLFYLAVTGQCHSRGHLATLLWSEVPAENARRSLRATLFQLRRTLAAAAFDQTLGEEGDALRLHLAENSCDVSHFDRLVAEGSEPALVQAVVLYRGPLLEGFTL